MAKWKKWEKRVGAWSVVERGLWGFSAKSLGHRRIFSNFPLYVRDSDFPDCDRGLFKFYSWIESLSRFSPKKCSFSDSISTSEINAQLKVKNPVYVLFVVWYFAKSTGTVVPLLSTFCNRRRRRGFGDRGMMSRRVSRRFMVIIIIISSSSG